MSRDIHFDDCKEIIKSIKTKLIPKDELETMSTIDMQEACFNNFLEICFQTTVMLYAGKYHKEVDAVTTLIDMYKNVAAFNKHDGNHIFSRAKQRMSVFEEYQKLVIFNPYRDWIGDIFMEMVGQYKTGKKNKHAFFPTPEKVAQAGLMMLDMNDHKSDTDTINIAEICCGTATITLQSLKIMNEKGRLGNCRFRLTDIDTRMAKIAATQCLSVMLCTGIQFILQVINQNDITEEVQGVAFSNIGLYIPKAHSEGGWSPKFRVPTEEEKYIASCQKFVEVLPIIQGLGKVHDEEEFEKAA